MLSLILILQTHREEIATAWAEMVHRLPDSHYRERPLEELGGGRVFGVFNVSYTGPRAFDQESIRKLRQGLA